MPSVFISRWHFLFWSNPYRVVNSTYIFRCYCNRTPTEFYGI